ncbi:GNAT family N-acetyltransferase [Irregularibacter muris]|uniref:GNAT family N-acetyltransferase n=1 Tax=Irregularibacter muris TaxID=1796619 RepID=A0AAE3KZW6_9FIRM|nr:GNAT family N-acetyltransferase [Irregularibacter muris]MCR1898862.1 GNAT family N-acetyltransferase [Irregularibacter muris]
MTFDIQRLSQNNAEVIANEWKYPGVYEFYNMTSDPEDYKEIITPNLRKNNYFQVIKENKLFGFFVVEKASDSDDIVDMGLGIKPELTGKGLGQKFLLEILNYIYKNHSAKIIRLGVASFNHRAKKVYEKVGFRQTKIYEQATNGSVYEFIEMKKEL